ncbi:unnamed protein product, partial [Prorocentrum cordatum]
ASGAALPPGGAVTLRRLQSRPELNDRPATVLRWVGSAGRFAVRLEGTPLSILVRAPCLSPRGVLDAEPGWAQMEGQLGPLAVDVVLAVARALPVRTVAALSGASRGLRATLWLRPDAVRLWDELLERSYGALALTVADRAQPGISGAARFRCARALRQLFREGLQVVLGSVTDQCSKDSVDVIACPCLRSMYNAHIGAQGAIREAAGHELEAAVAALQRPVAPSSVTLVPGGELCRRVAMTVTEPPEEVFHEMAGLRRTGQQHEAKVAFIRFLEGVHRNLLGALRGDSGGFRTLATPTMFTGGMGVEVHLVAMGCVRSFWADLCENPADPIMMRVACFERGHAPVFNMMKEEWLKNFYRPEEADRMLLEALRSTADADDDFF